MLVLITVILQSSIHLEVMLPGLHTRALPPSRPYRVSVSGFVSRYDRCLSSGYCTGNRPVPMGFSAFGLSASVSDCRSFRQISHSSSYRSPSREAKNHRAVIPHG